MYQQPSIASERNSIFLQYKFNQFPIAHIVPVSGIKTGHTQKFRKFSEICICNQSQSLKQYRLVPALRYRVL